jgi:transcriptional regulator with XRE-family HTH domain
MEVIITEKERENIRIGFGNLLRAKRQEIGISQEELAFRSGLHRTYVGIFLLNVQDAQANLHARKKLR